MKVSLNWVKEYLDFELPPLEELVNRIGEQLGSVDEVTDLSAKYKDVIVAKVVDCKKHDNADNLSLCKIDDGHKLKDATRDAEGFIQVVCGAPNVKTGQIVAWLPPGTTVPSSYGKEPFVLEVREIRGQVSNGMLASPKELDLYDDQNGILELSEGQPGDSFAKLLKLDDVIIDIENKMFTHRPDCFGILGIAREIAGILGQPFKSPADYTNQPTPAAAKEDLLEVKNELQELVSRFSVGVFMGVKVGDSPLWLKAILSRAGIRPVNNIVDLTNYFMVLTGQPLHAYDYDKLKALDGGNKATIIVRNPKPGEKLTLINGKEVEPGPEVIAIASTSQLIGIGGVMGGSQTEVDETTQNIVLECAAFDMYSIRRTSMSLGVFSDAVTRFGKGQSPLQNLHVLAWASKSIVDIAGGQSIGIFDLNNLPATTTERDSVFPPITLEATYVNGLLGIDLSAEAMAKLLQNVEFAVSITDQTMTVKAPFWRTDIELREDVAEEVGRLYGYDKLPLILPIRDISPATKNAGLEAQGSIRQVLAEAGANEVLTYSFVHSNLLQKVGQNPELAYKLSNALSPNLEHYRLSLTPSLLEKVHPNIKAGYDEFAIFEIGKSHATEVTDEDGLPAELESLALVFAADAKKSKQNHGAAYYKARAFLDELLSKTAPTLDYKLMPAGPKIKAKDALFQQMFAPFDSGRAAVIMVGDEAIGVVGEYTVATRRNLKLPGYCAGFELSLSAITQLTTSKLYTPLSRFPKVTQDVTLKLASDTPFSDLYDLLSVELAAKQPKNCTTSLKPLGVYQNAEDIANKNFSFRVAISSYERTLTDTEVNNLLESIAQAASQKLGAQRV